jgi:enoyl-CoA hydratase
MSGDNVVVEEQDDGQVVRLVINRPHQGNVLDQRTIDQLITALTDAEDSQWVRVVVIRGCGHVFSGGADVAAMIDMSPLDFRDYGLAIVSLYERITRLEKPVIAAVNGAAYGAGNALVMACDLRVAAANATFGQQEILLGLFGGTALLPRHVKNPARAAEVIMTGAVLSAEEALELGLVGRIVAPERLDEEVGALCRALQAQSADALKLAKVALRLDAQILDSSKALESQINLVSLAFATEERRARMEAFLSRRRGSGTAKGGSEGSMAGGTEDGAREGHQ